MIALALSAAACTAPGPDVNPGPFHKWFNPGGQQVSGNEPAACPASAPADPAILPVPGGGAPAGVPEGYSYATFQLVASALLVTDSGPVGRNVCLPISIHAYINVGGQSAPITTAEQGVVTTPWDALRKTPYSATGLLVWSNKLPAAPLVMIDWSAKYEAEIDHKGHGTDVVALMCQVFVNGREVKRVISVDVDRLTVPLPGADNAVAGPLARCRMDAFSPSAA